MVTNSRNLEENFSQFNRWLHEAVPISTLVWFRVSFGVLIVFSTLRFFYLGWIEDQYLDPVFHFTYYGFDWIQVYSELFLYLLFGILSLAAIGVLLGLLYRLSISILFISFTYIELIDKAYYLNHYYFVSIAAFLLIWLPANKNFSIDAKLKPAIRCSFVPKWTTLSLQLLLAIVYVAAGIAKINTDWLLNALPLKIWLPAKDSLAIIGALFSLKITPYLFSWAGMLFDTLIPFLLWHKKTRLLAYIAVIIFHSLTGILFQIGVFPIVMILLTPIFFDATTLKKFLLFGRLPFYEVENVYTPKSTLAIKVVSIFLIIQLFLPFRPLLYAGNMFWTEEGYRFGWRVMLAEKAGNATFFIRDGGIQNSREYVIDNADYLNKHQEKQMAFQPDMILQFAHFLDREMRLKYGMIDPIIRCEAYVSLNARPSKLLINPEVDLSEQKRGWKHKEWIMDYPY